MAKLIAITDAGGALLGVLRGDPIDIGSGMTIQAAPTPAPGSAHQHHILEVPNDLLGKPTREIHDEVRRRLGRRAR